MVAKDTLLDKPDGANILVELEGGRMSELFATLLTRYRLIRSVMCLHMTGMSPLTFKLL